MNIQRSGNVDFFSDLKKLGISNIGGLFEEEEKEKAVAAAEKHVKTPEELETETLFDKTYECAVCNKQFTTKAVRAGRAKLVSSDTDLRAVYDHVDVNKYDAIVCPFCGYAALNKFFTVNTQVQRNLIREQIQTNFKGLPFDGSGIINHDEALLKYKLVLANAVVKKAKNSEKAYICLKTAWVIRGKKDALAARGELTPEKSDELLKEENAYLKQAYTGFTAALPREDFPMCGMDEPTLIYLMADLARRIGDKEQAKKFLSEVIMSKTVQPRLKDKARELKNIIDNDK